MSPRRLAAVPDAPRRAVALVRVSKAKGRDDLISPELQRTAIGDYAARSGIDVVEWVEALDESASRDRSPWWRTLEQAVASVEAGERDVVLVWKFSRAARHRRRWAIAVDRIEVAGGTLESATEGLDTTTSTGRLARGMLAELAAWESEVKGEQWKEAQARRRSRGLPHNGGPRFGYLYGKATGYRPDPETGPMLAGLYRRYAAGEGFQALAKWLNAQQVPTMRGGQWAVQTLIRQLDSGFAAGLLLIARTGELKPAAHDPLITEAEWAAYLARRQQMRRLGPRARAPLYVLTGLVRCGLCGSAMSATSSQRGAGYAYRCTRYVASRSCPGVWMKREDVEAQVLAWLEREVADVDQRAATKVARRAAATTAKSDRARLARAVTKLDEQLHRLTVDLASGLVPAAAYASARDEIAGRRQEAADALAQAEHDSAGLAGSHVPVIAGLVRDWETLSVARRRDMLMQYVLRSVRLFPDEPRVLPVPLWEDRL